MVILGKDERLKFEKDRENYSKEVQQIYNEAQTYHDGKWIMFEPIDTSLFDDFILLNDFTCRETRLHNADWFNRMITLGSI